MKLLLAKDEASRRMCWPKRPSNRQALGLGTLSSFLCYATRPLLTLSGWFLIPSAID